MQCVQQSEPASAPASLSCTVHPSNNAEKGESKLQWLYDLATWPEGITAWLLALTLIAIGWQSWETSISAKAMRDSIQLQQAGMQQWVDVEARTAESVEREPRQGNFDFVVILSFEAVNNTANPLTIIKIETAIDMAHGEAEVFTVEENVTLPPRKESSNNRYAFHVPAQSIKRESFTCGATVVINGCVTFRDCLKNSRSDYFGGLYHCKDGEFVKLKMLGISPSRTVKASHIPSMTGTDASGMPWTRDAANRRFWQRWRWQMWKSPKNPRAENEEQS